MRIAVSSTGATTVRSGRGEGRRDTEDDELEPGRNVGRYVTLGAVGRGATGVVYRAYDPELDRRLALKLFPVTSDRGAMLREARALARLRHTNVVTVFDVGEHEGRVFVAMELVEGSDLRGWLGAEARTPEQVKRVLAQAGRGLVAAHEAGVVHCDFKPSNVLVGADGSVRVADFGLARHAQAKRHANVGTGADLLAAGSSDEGASLPAGTPAYLAPELYGGDAANTRSDLYAFCVTCWESLFGERPWTREDEFELLERKREGVPSLPTSPRIGAALASSLEAGLDADPSARPETLATILAALDPQPKRQRWPMVAVGAGAVAIIAYATTRPAPCDSADQRTDPVWNDAVRRTIADGLDASGIAHADTTAAQLQANVDRYVVQWGAQYREACEATHVRHEQSERLLDLRMECLARKLDQLGVVLELIRVEPETVAVESSRAIAKLEGTLACGVADVDPDAPKATPEVAALEKDLDRIEVMEAVAQYDEAMALARAAEEKAGQLETPALEIRARYRVARLLDLTGDPKAAAAALAEVHWAAEAAGVDDVAAQAGIYLVYEHAAVFNDSKTALAWAPHVDAAVKRAGDRDLDRAALIEKIGIAHLYLQQPEPAEAKFEESLRLREAAADALGIVSSLGNLGILYEETHRYDKAIAQHERGLAILKERVGEHHPYTARVLDNLGTAHLRKGDIAAALDYFRPALQIRRTVLGPRHRKVGVSYVHLGYAALSQGDPDAAIEHYGHALDIYGDVFDDTAVDVLQVHEGLAHTYAAKKDLSTARAHANTALAGLRGKLAADHPEIKALEAIVDRSQ